MGRSKPEKVKHINGKAEISRDISSSMMKIKLQKSTKEYMLFKSKNETVESTFSGKNRDQTSIEYMLFKSKDEISANTCSQKTRIHLPRKKYS